MSRINQYGLSSQDLEHAKAKLAKQKDYLESNKFLGANGEEKSLLDVSYSANLSKRYYPRILNKVDTFISYGIDNNLVPIFLTITLDGFFRDLLKGDYRRFTEKKRKEYLSHIPNNDRNGYYLDYMDEMNTLTPKDLYKILSHQLHRFTRSTTLQNIRQKHNLDYTMIRVTEPHKDGTPHMHILMHVPEQFIPALFLEFKKYFPAPQNHKTINYKEDKRDPLEICPGMKETKGFQTEIRIPAGYILKYILKSFVNLIQGKDLDYLQAWYVHNRIPRLITTHTLLSQDVYYHASMLDNDWYYLTNIKNNHYYERDKMMNSFKLVENDRELIYDNGLYQIKNRGKIVKEFGENKVFKIRFTVDCPIKYPKPPNTLGTMLTDMYWRFKVKRKYVYKIELDDNLVDVQFPDGKILLFNKITGEVSNGREHIPITKLSDLDLFEWFYDFDIEKHDIKKLGLIKNTMIERGLLKEVKTNLNNYNYYL